MQHSVATKKTKRRPDDRSEKKLDEASQISNLISSHRKEIKHSKGKRIEQESKYCTPLITIRSTCILAKIYFKSTLECGCIFRLSSMKPT